LILEGLAYPTPWAAKVIRNPSQERALSRAAEACAILTPALEGFSPTAEMPEINDAQALLELLTHSA